MFTCRLASRVLLQRRAASLCVQGSRRFICSEIPTKIAKLEVESALVTISTPLLGMEFVRQLINLPRPPRHVFAVCKQKEVLNAVEELREIASGETSLYLVHLDMEDKEDLRIATELVHLLVRGRGLSLLVNNSEMQIHTAPCVGKDYIRKFFTNNGYGPVQVTEAFVPLLETAARRPEFRGLKMSASRASVLNIPSFFPFYPDSEGIHDWNSALGYWSATIGPTVGMVRVLNTVRGRDIFVVQIDPEWEKKDLLTRLEKLDLSGYVFDMLNTLAECEPEVHGSCINRHGEIFTKTY